MTKSKKLWLIGGMATAAIVPIIAVVSCGSTTTTKTANEILPTAVTSKTGNIYLKAGEGDLASQTAITTSDVTDVNTYAASLSAAQLASLVTVKEASKSKKTNVLTGTDFDLIALPGTVNGITASMGTPAPDARFNTVANVPVYLTKGSVNSANRNQAMVIVQIPGFTAPDANYQKGTVATAFGDNTNVRWTNATSYSEQNTKSLGYSSTTNNTLTQGNQNSFLQTQITNNVKGISLGAATSGGVGDSITKAADKNIPVVAYDRIILSDSKTYNFYTTFDNTGVGVLQGLALVSGLVGKTGEPFKTIEEMQTYVNGLSDAKKPAISAMLFAGDPADDNAPLFFNGAKSVLDAFKTSYGSNFTIFGGDTFDSVATSGWNASTAGSNFDTKYDAATTEQKANLKGILAPNDNLALALVGRLEAKGIDPTKVYVTGQDAISNSVVNINDDGGQNMTVLKSDFALTAVNLSILEYLINTEGAATRASSDWTDDQLKELQNYVAVRNPLIKFSVKKTGFSTTNGKAIITFLLEPTTIVKSNISTYYTIATS